MNVESGVSTVTILKESVLCVPLPYRCVKSCTVLIYSGISSSVLNTKNLFCCCFTAQVDRKIKSLKGHYNTMKRLIKSGSVGGKKPLWPQYDRLQNFLGATEYKPWRNKIIMKPVSKLFVIDIKETFVLF